MLFNSLSFLVFSIFFYGLWPFLYKSAQVRYGFIVVASLIFYGWAEPIYILLLLFTGMVDFLAGLAMGRWPAHKRMLLLSSLVCNLGVLGHFKYSGFLAQNLNQMLTWLSLPGQLPVHYYALPVGISFYTFQSINYSISVYRGEMQPTRNWLHFLSFIAMFPHLVAGPLVRASDILPQLERAGMPTPEQRWEGMRFICKGFFKKVVIADNLALPVDAAFAAAGSNSSSLCWWWAAALFAYQIYCDFSGYSDIARGLARFLGVDFAMNFNHPYSSQGFSDFWRRWHISLSTWFRDYVYIPLGGSRGGTLAEHRNLWTTMLISAVWHGANWTFIVWGLLHSLYLSLERVTGWQKWGGNGPFIRLFRWTVVFSAACIAWVFFRAPNLAVGFDIVSKMLHFQLVGSDFALGKSIMGGKSLGILGLCILWDWLRVLGISQRLYQRLYFLEPYALGLLLTASVFLRGPGHTFIYFQF